MCAPTARSRCCRKFEVNDPLLTRRSALRERAQIDPADERSRGGILREDCVLPDPLRAGTHRARRGHRCGSCRRTRRLRLMRDRRVGRRRSPCAQLWPGAGSPARRSLHRTRVPAQPPPRARTRAPPQPPWRARARACRPGAAPCCRPACAPCRSCPSVRAAGSRSVLQTRRAAVARHWRRSRTARGARDRAGLQAGSAASGSRHRGRARFARPAKTLEPGDLRLMSSFGHRRARRLDAARHHHPRQINARRVVGQAGPLARVNRG